VSEPRLSQTAKSPAVETAGLSLIGSIRLLDQVSKLAAASTIPVTNAAMQENSKMSFRTLAMTASPYGSPPSAAHRRPRHHGQKVAEPGQKCMPLAAREAAAILTRCSEPDRSPRNARRGDSGLPFRAAAARALRHRRGASLGAGRSGHSRSARCRGCVLLLYCEQRSGVGRAVSARFAAPRGGRNSLRSAVPN
jgi:hypothetical protein